MQNEMLDSEEIPVELLNRNLREIDFLNRYLGGHATSLQGISKLINDRKKQYKIIDLGCGSGEWMKHTARWARKNRFCF